MPEACSVTMLLAFSRAAQTPLQPRNATGLDFPVPPGAYDVS